MKYLYALIICLSCLVHAEESDETPQDGEIERKSKVTAVTFAEKLLDIHDEMVALEDKLNDDRHDTTLVIDSGKIEESLTKLIEEIERNEKSQKESKSSESPGKPPKVPEGITRELQPDIAWHIRMLELGLDPNKVTHWGTEFPSRWRNRIAAYFVSVNAEENRPIAKKEP